MSERRGPPIDFKGLAARLAERAAALAAEILPDGRRERGLVRCGSIAGYAPRGSGSFIYNIAGPYQGTWHEFDDGSHGDSLDLIAFNLFGGDKVQAVHWARRWLGIDDAGPTATPQRRAQEIRAQQAAGAAKASPAAAKSLWLSAPAELGGTPAAAYLAGRGIGLDALRQAPRALRCHPGLRHEESGQTFPAMVAAIVDPAGVHIGTHRTFLARDPRGQWGKAPVTPAKKVFGAFKGGAIYLWRGASGKPMREAPASDVVAITEGIEDALTVALASPEWRVIAAVSVGNLANITLPDAIGQVVIVAQRDGENDAVARARDMAMRRFTGEGREVRLAMPPQGHKDFNDWHQARLRGEAA